MLYQGCKWDGTRPIPSHIFFEFVSQSHPIPWENMIYPSGMGWDLSHPKLSHPIYIPVLYVTYSIFSLKNIRGSAKKKRLERMRGIDSRVNSTSSLISEPTSEFDTSFDETSDHSRSTERISQKSSAGLRFGWDIFHFWRNFWFFVRN